VQKTLLAVCGVFGAMVAAILAQSGRPMTLDDLLLAVRVADPQVSPDGRLVAYVRTTTDLTAGRRNGDIWGVPTDGSSAPRLLAGGEKGESAPRFSGDGGKLAFISARAGAPQVFVMDVKGGEARQITKLAAGVQPPLAFSADGSKVAFVSDVEIDGGKPAEDPVKVRRLTRLLFRHWDEWRIGVRHHVFVADVSGNAEPRDVTPGDFDSPPHFYEDGGVAFSPDGKEIAFVSNREGGDREAWTTNKDVWIVSAAGGEAVRLTSNPAADETPVWAPDGKSIAVRAQRRAGFESDRWYIDVYDRATRSRRTGFESPDLSAGELVFSPDATTIWFTAADKGTENLYLVPAAGGSPRLVTKGGAIASPRAGRDVVVYARSSLTAPPEVFALSTAGGGSRQLTRENAGWTKEVAWPTLESLTVPGAGGTPIQYWLLRPPGFSPSRKYPVVFLIHGGPQGAWEDAWSSRWNPALWAAQGWVIAAPNPRGSTGFGQSFVDEISQDWGGRVMTDLDAVFDSVSKLPFVDASRMGIAGASYGGYAVNWIIGHTDRFKAAVSHDGVFNLESMAYATEELWFTEWEFGGPPWTDRARANLEKWSPHRHVDKVKTPTLVITNELDFRVPVDQGLQLFTALRRNGVPSEALVFPDEGHWVLQPLNSKRWHESVFGWLKKYLAAAESSSGNGEDGDSYAR
jgi:dipeptidyl aminopeptidase/acylaminoacyl peptidase